MKSTLSHWITPALMGGVLISAFLGGPFFPISFKEYAFAISMSIKELLIFILPFLIGTLLFLSLARLRTQAFKFLILIVPIICVSNFISTWLAYGIGWVSFNSGGGSAISTLIPTVNQSLTLPFEIHFPPLISNQVALILGGGAGLITGFFPNFLTNETLRVVHSTLTKLLRKTLIPIMPFFIFGFALKIQTEGIIQESIVHYTRVFGIFSGAALIYVLFLYAVGCGFNFLAVVRALKNMIPAYLSAISTSSSAVSMPLTILGCEANLKNSALAHSVVPATVGCHMQGDCFSIPLMALSMCAGIEFPGLLAYLIFSWFFVLNKFAVPGVPGGGILVMLPVLSTYLHLDSGMISLITALYIIFDPIITGFNVLGNGAFALIFEKIYNRFESRPHIQ